MRRAACSLLIVAWLGGAARAAELAEMVRDLNVLQNRMVIGDMAAREQAAKQFDLIEKAIAAVEPEAWAEERNQRAAIVYLLCGGASAGLREIHEAGFDIGKLGDVVGASVEYAEGRDGGVPKALMDFDARHLPPILGGHLALVQGSGLTGEDDARAIALFDLARLLMPGSLVEEAALRREIAILDPVRDVDKLSLLSSRYVSKYLHSPYVQNFWEVLRRATIADPTFLARASKFEAIFAKASAAERVTHDLAVARMAILAGDFDEARRQLDNAAKVATHPSTLKRIDSYRGVLVTLTQENAGSPPTLEDMDKLEKQDTTLFAVAAGVATRLAERQPPTSAPEDDYEMAAVVRQALTRSDELLKRAGPQ